MSTNESGKHSEELFPPLPIEEWEDTKNTLHLFMQIVGKIRLKSFPKMNHWWHVTLYVAPRGLTTRSIPYDGMIFEIAFDFIDHKLVIVTSQGATRFIPLNGLNVAEFYKSLMSELADLGIDVDIVAEPYDVPFSSEPFATDTTHGTYDEQFVNRYWHILLNVDNVFERFRARFIGKSTPVHLYWHHADLAVTRFSGKEAPYQNENATNADKEAYSHEVISFGFWAGDENVRAPAFYSYTYPEPEGLTTEELLPKEAFWNTDSGSAMAVLMYDDLRKSDSPEDTLLEFLESSYNAGAKKANWDIEALSLKGS